MALKSGLGDRQQNGKMTAGGRFETFLLSGESMQVEATRQWVLVQRRGNTKATKFSHLCKVFDFSVFSPGTFSLFCSSHFGLSFILLVHDFSARLSKSPFLIQLFFTMSKKLKNYNIKLAQIDIIIITIDIYNNYITNVVKNVNCSKSTIKTLKKRIHEKIDKKNIFSLQAINYKTSRNLRFFKLNIKNRRR